MTYCRFEVYEDDDGGYRWRFTSGSEIVTCSGEGYGSESEAKEAAELLREEVPDANISGDEEPYLELYQDQDDGWRWRMVSSSGRTITSEQYPSRIGVKKIARSVRTSAGRAEVTTA